MSGSPTESVVCEPHWSRRQPLPSSSLRGSGTACGSFDDSAVVPLVQIRLLPAIPIFAALPAPELEGVAKELEPVPVRAGTTVFHEGDSGDKYYAVSSGSLRIVRHGELVQTVTRGQGFGEIALIRDIPRQATVTAESDALLYSLEKDLFVVTLTRHAGATTAARAASSRITWERTSFRRPCRGTVGVGPLDHADGTRWGRQELLGPALGTCPTCEVPGWDIEGGARRARPFDLLGSGRLWVSGQSMSNPTASWTGASHPIAGGGKLTHLAAMPMVMMSNDDRVAGPSRARSHRTSGRRPSLT